MQHDVGDAALGVAAQGDSEARRFGEQRVNRLAVGERLLVGQFQQPIAYGKSFSISSFHPSARHGVLQALAEGKGCHGPLLHVAQQLAVQRSRVAEVEAHPLGGIAAQVVVNAQRVFRGVGLKFVGESIVVTAVAVMEKASDAAQELHRVAREFVFIQRTDSRVAAIAGELAHPERGMVIAQSARRFFYVRLEMEDRVAIARQAFAGEALQFRMQQRPGLFFGAQQNLGVQFFEELRIAVQKAAIQHRQMKFGIGFFDVPAFVQRAAGGADAEAEVPKGA